MENIVDFGTLRSGDSFSGLACIKSMTIAKTKNGKDYIYGSCVNKKQAIQFKIWDSTLVGLLRAYIDVPSGYKTSVAKVAGTVGIYQGALDYTFGSVQLLADTPECCVSMFLPSLDIEPMFKDFCEFVNKLDKPWIQVLNAITQLPIQVFDGNMGDTSKTGTIIDLFKTGWAASSHHDAIAGGLLNHVCKMLKYAEVLVANNPVFEQYKNLIYTGIILHDIGKTQEIVNGVYTKNSFVSHRVMGVEYLAMQKPLITSLIGVDNYYRLVSIIIGHHDKYGNPADTVWAYLVHLIDMIDSQATLIEEAIVNDTASISSSNEKYITRDGQRLNF